MGGEGGLCKDIMVITLKPPHSLPFCRFCVIKNLRAFARFLGLLEKQSKKQSSLQNIFFSFFTGCTLSEPLISRARPIPVQTNRLVVTGPLH